MSDRCTAVAVHSDGELCHCYYDSNHSLRFRHDCGHPEHTRWSDPFEQLESATEQ